MSGKSRPLRTCLGCRSAFDQRELARYVLAPDDRVLVDYRQKLPGRGAYSCVSIECVTKACRQRQFDRAFKRSGVTPAAEELLAQLQAQLQSRVESLIGMARKAGQLSGGSQQVLAELDGDTTIGLVIVAGDISTGVLEKVARKAQFQHLQTCRLLDKERLGQLVGRAERSVLAIRRGELCDNLKHELRRYEQIAGER